MRKGLLRLYFAILLIYPVIWICKELVVERSPTWWSVPTVLLTVGAWITFLVIASNRTDEDWKI